MVDLIGAYLALVHVAERGSFTLGAAAAGIPQSVASRRIAALEEHLGGRLFDRSTRRAALTPFGHDLLPSAKRLVRLAESMADEARRALLRPVPMAVPDTCDTLGLARLTAAARAHGVLLDPRPAQPAERAELARTGQVRLALLAVPAAEAAWTVPLGLARVAPARAGAIYLESLRTSRGEPPAARRRVWVQPEDDVPHVRDRVCQVRDSVGLLPSQVVIADSLVAAVADVLGSDNLLLCSRAQARGLDLRWRPLGELRPARGFDLAADPYGLRATLDDGIARCLGAREGDGG